MAFAARGRGTPQSGVPFARRYASVAGESDPTVVSAGGAATGSGSVAATCCCSSGAACSTGACSVAAGAGDHELESVAFHVEQRCREGRLSSNAEPKRRRSGCYRRLVIMVLLDKLLRVNRVNSRSKITRRPQGRARRIEGCLARTPRGHQGQRRGDAVNRLDLRLRLRPGRFRGACGGSP